MSEKFKWKDSLQIIHQNANSLKVTIDLEKGTDWRTVPDKKK
jgi:hypothetical protein